jgi:hypothetical protein
MKTRPKELTFLALFLFAVAMGLPAQVMMLYGHPLSEMTAVLAKLTPLNWAILFSAPVVGLLLMRAHASSRYLVPLFGMLVVYNNWFVAEVSGDFDSTQVKISTGVFLVALATIFTKDVREILTHPEKRWWLTPMRKRMELPIRVCFFNKRGSDSIRSSEFYARTFDVSMGGSFVNLDDDDMALMTEETLQNLKVGTQCYISLTLKDLCFLQCRAEIVRRTHSHGNYPGGVGLRFLGLSWNDERTLREHLRKARSASGSAELKPATAKAAA